MTPSIRVSQPLVMATGVPATPSARRDWSGFLAEARKRFQRAAEAERTIRLEALEDLKFYAGDQWPQQVKTDRDLTNRPCLTINRLPQFAKQVINAQRAARPSIQVNPVGDGADVDTAQIIQGLTRHIEINSDAEIAYDTAFEHAVIHGFGYFRITTDYVDDDSFDQEIKLERILNPFAVYFDPCTQKPDHSDAQYCFIVEDIPFDVYKATYPDSDVASLSDFRSIGDSERDWFTNGSVRVAEYFYIEGEEKYLVKLADGRTVTEEEITPDDEIAQWKGNPLRRIAHVKKVRWCRMNAREILEPNAGDEPATWPGKFIPIIKVVGDELIVDGKKKLIGIVRHAKDAQRMYNYARTGVVEQLALSSKAPWLVAEGQIEGYEELWRQSNVRNTVVLPYKPKTIGNQPVPAPIRNTFEPPIHGLTASLAQSDNDLKATTGIYDASLGERGPDESGKAILARQEQGQTATSNFLDNLSRSIRFAGRAILDLVPHIYDVPRVVRIVNPDQSHKMVQINQPFEEQGALKLYDVTTGRYDVTISVGPSYQSKRQEFVQSVLSLVQAVPQTMQFVMDLLVSNMDWPGAREISERLKKMLPPQLQDQDGQDQPPVPPQIQAQLQMLMQQNAALIKQLENSTSIINTKRLELESKERIAALQGQVTLLAAELKARTSNAEKLAQLEYDSIHKRLDLLHEDEPIEAETAAASAPAAPQGAPAAQQ